MSTHTPQSTFSGSERRSPNGALLRLHILGTWEVRCSTTDAATAKASAMTLVLSNSSAAQRRPDMDSGSRELDKGKKSLKKKVCSVLHSSGCLSILMLLTPLAEVTP